MAASAAPLANPKPNLESAWPVRTNSWVWASMPGVMRSSTRGAGRPSACEPVEAVELVEGVDDDVADADLQRRGQLVGRLVVAVQHQPGGRHPGGQRHVHLAAGRHVEQQALLVGEAGHGAAEERLRRVARRPAPKAATASRHRDRRWASS